MLSLYGFFCHSMFQVHKIYQFFFTNEASDCSDPFPLSSPMCLLLFLPWFNQQVNQSILLSSFLTSSTIIRLSRDGPYYVIEYGGRQAAGGGWWAVGVGRPHRFPHNNFSSVYRIFTKLGHIIPLQMGKDAIYFRVIRSNFKVTVTINRNFDNRVVSAL